MKLQEIEINQAQHLRLCEELNINGNLLPKNHILTKDDITHLKLLGRTHIFAAAAESGDIDFNTALGIVAAKICGQNLAFRIDDRGFAEIAAVNKGIFDVSSERLNKFNRFSEYFILNTIKPYRLVNSGEIVARIEILPPIIAQDDVDKLIFSLSGNETLLNIRTPRRQHAAILYTRFYNDNNELENITESTDKLLAEYKPLNLTFMAEKTADHMIDSVVDCLLDLLNSAADVIFIVPALRGCGENDIIYAAVKSIADQIICPHIPLLGGSDLLIAVRKQKKIICLPHHYNYIDSPLINNFVRAALCKEKLYTQDFKHAENAVMDNSGIIKDISTLIRAADSTKTRRASVAAVVLAAGQSKRLGKNKLLADVHNEPLALKAIKAAIASDAAPVFVVTGHQAEDIEAELENFDINIIYNPNYRMGVKTTIDLGLKSVPDFCDAAILIPADMPNITPELINKMIAAFNKKQEKQLILAAAHGVKSNPVLWSKALFSCADLAAENADLRPIFLEHSDYTTLIEASDKELADINFQNDLEQLLKTV